MPTNKVYVGSSIQGHRRVFSHTRILGTEGTATATCKGLGTNTGLRLEWHVVEQCNPDKLLAREQWWIGFLRAADKRYGFNLCFPVTDKQSELKSNLSLTQIEKWRDPEIRVKRLTGLKTLHKDPVWKSDRARAMAARWQNPNWHAGNCSKCFLQMLMACRIRCTMSLGLSNTVCAASSRSNNVHWACVRAWANPGREDLLQTRQEYVKAGGKCPAPWAKKRCPRRNSFVMNGLSQGVYGDGTVTNSVGGLQLLVASSPNYWRGGRH